MKFGRNYDTEIMELNQKTTGLRTDTDNNTSEIISIGNEFGKYKLEMNNIVKSLLEEHHNLLKEYNDLRIVIMNLKEDAKKEIEIKDTTDMMTCADICDQLTDVKHLNPTSLKYYLYELGLLTLSINKRLNTYKAVSNYKDISTDISQYMYVKGRVITFDKDAIEYFKKHLNDLRESANRYTRKLEQFSKSKDNIDTLKVKNYEDEIKSICGIGNNFDKSKWSKIYNIYKKNHPNFWNEHKKYADTYMLEHPNEKRPTVISYLVQQCGDGDVLLRIACELFVA